jgi:hypothetical protein
MEALFTYNKTTKMLKVMLAFVFALGLTFVMLPTIAFGATTTLSIPVEQIFSATPGIERDGTFSYVMQRLDQRYPLPQGSQGDNYNFTLTGNQVRDIGPITFDRAGTFRYEVRSDAEQLGGFTLDARIYTVYIGVINTPGGGLSASIEAVFVHTLANPLPIKVADGNIIFDKGYGALAGGPEDNPPVVKTVIGNPSQDYTFTFRLTAQTEGAPMPAGASGNTADITIAGSGRAYFGMWEYTVGGIFVYEVREIASNNSGEEFDTTVYTVTDTVTSQGGQLVVDRIVTNADNRPVTSMSFINVYTGTTPPPPPPPTPGTTTPTPGPKTGDYADPVALMLAMALSASIALFTLFLIYMDRRSEKEHGEVAVG